MSAIKMPHFGFFEPPYRGSVDNDMGHCKTDNHKMNVTLAALKEVKKGNLKITSKDACVSMHNDTVHVMKGSEVNEVLLFLSSDHEKIEGVATRW